MRILIAPDKFKGSLSAREVGENIAVGLRAVLPDAMINVLPVADGGEGTAEVICHARVGEWITCNGHDALGREITARHVWLGERKTAVIEMSETAGAWRIAPRDRNPLLANTYGVGEMLLQATRRGAEQIIVGLGGSATNDGGFGMARALGFRFLDRHGLELKGSIPGLRDLNHIVAPQDLVLPRIIAAADVRHPLLGPHGATRTFGPQKGILPDQLEMFEEALAQLADVVSRDLGCDFRETPGAGAAGGLGFCLMSFCGGIVKPGLDLVAEMIDLEAIMQRADVVITGEGTLDEQTFEGKAPSGVARIARKLGKRLFAIVGCATDEAKARATFDDVLVLARAPITHEESMSRTAMLLQERARELGEMLSRD